jgi:hypothetical protein
MSGIATPPAAYNVCVWRNGEQSAATKVHVEPGKATAVELRIRR